jgi:hypothetical protein
MMTKPEMMSLYIVPIALSLGDWEALVGDVGFEAPKRPMTPAQIVAFEKAWAKRAENVAKKGGSKPAPKHEP